MSERIILVEGYHDRAFWKGMLIRAGCNDLAAAPGTAGIRVVDPTGKPVTGGHFAFRSRSGVFVRLQPCNGDDGVLREVRIRLQGRNTRPVDHLVACLDADVDAGRDARAKTASIQAAVQQAEASSLPNAAGTFDLADGTRVSPVIWQATDPHSNLLPAQECLERLVVAALTDIYPDRAAAVRDWLLSRPSPPSENPKAHAWSHMAGWYPGLGCEAFLSEVWSDPAIAGALRARLQATGVWDVVDALVS